MDVETLGAAIAVSKLVPGTSAQRAETAQAAAEAAQAAAEAAATSAASHNYGITVSGTTLQIEEPVDTTLSALSIGSYELTPSFSAGTTEYTVNWPVTNTDVEISATANDTDQSVFVIVYTNVSPGMQGGRSPFTWNTGSAGGVSSIDIMVGQGSSATHYIITNTAE